MHNLPITHVTFAQKLNFIQRFIGRWVRFYPFWPPFFPLMFPKQGKFGWYIKNYHMHNLAITHMTFSQKITFIQGFIERWARFYPFWPQFCHLMSPKQDKFGWCIENCHMHNLPITHVTFAQNITFIQGFIGRWARFYPFWPPFFPLCPLKKVNLGDISKIVTYTTFLSLMWHLPRK